MKVVWQQDYKKPVVNHTKIKTETALRMDTQAQAETGRSMMQTKGISKDRKSAPTDRVNIEDGSWAKPRERSIDVSADNKILMKE